MTGEGVQYKGRTVSKDGFRVFVYGTQGQKKLVNSWDEFERHMASGLWFPSQDEATKPQEVERIYVKSRKKGRD